MPDQKASRTLVKSAPELWAECSEAASLAKHLGAFGDIRITKLEPETAVAWEGEAARGTVRLESAGWGTRVILTAGIDGPAPAATREPEPEPESAAPRPAGRWSRIFFWRRDVATEPPAIVAPPEPAPAASEVLDAALDSLGSAHHRPYSRT
jgi:hypothetical protein